MSIQIHRQNLRAIATAFARATGQSLGQVSKEFYGSWGGIKSFVDGANTISISKYYDMIDAITATWPEDAPWPEVRAVIIKRPAPKKTAHKKVFPRENSAPLS